MEWLKSPLTMRRLNGWLTFFWMVNVPPIVALYLIAGNDTFQRVCLLYLALVSIWANAAAHWGAWQAARVEVKQDEGAT